MAKDLQFCDSVPQNHINSKFSQHDLLYGGVSLSISLNLKLAPVPYATTKWPHQTWEVLKRLLFLGHRSSIKNKTQNSGDKHRQFSHFY